MEMNAHMPKMTVVVPVYNVELYLRRCLDSILHQTVADFEVILVDDGSTDGSGEICNEYAEKDRRFTVHHKTNGGVSTARNLGIDMAKGDYLFFVDADDWLEPIALEKSFDSINKNHVPDAVCFGFCYDNEPMNLATFSQEIEGGKCIEQFVCELTNGSAEALRHGVNLYAPWAKLYKRQIIDEHHLRFDNELKVAQDFWLNLCYFFYCENIVVDNTKVYHYFTNENSLVNRLSKERLQEGIRFLNRLKVYQREQLGNNGSFQNAIHYQLLKTVSAAMNSYFVHPDNKNGFWKNWHELRVFFQEPTIRHWKAELTLKDWQDFRDLRDIMLLKSHLFWTRLITIPIKRRIRRRLNL